MIRIPSQSDDPLSALEKIYKDNKSVLCEQENYFMYLCAIMLMIARQRVDSARTSGEHFGFGDTFIKYIATSKKYRYFANIEGNHKC